MDNQNAAIIRIKNALAKHHKMGLVLYSRTLLTKNIIGQLSEHNIRPLCICDRNPDLHGTKFAGAEVLSINSAKKRFGEFLIYIANTPKLYEIIHQLESSGVVSKEQIINYVPLVKKRGCHFLASGGCVVTNSRLHFCCGDTSLAWETPSVEFDGDYNKLVDDFCDLREKLLHELETGISSKCDGCALLQDIYTPHTVSITSVRDGRFSVCNFDCIYCCARKDAGTNLIDFAELVNAFKNKNMLSQSANGHYANGEISVYSERDKIFNCMKLFSSFQIATNAYVYSPEIAKLLRFNTSIMVSMDAGTRETFAKIKGVDGWGRCCDNLKRYASEATGEAIYLKYIFLPCLNDNKNDVDGFFALVKEIGASRVFISHDYTNSDKITEHTIGMAGYFINKARALPVPVTSSSNILSDRLGIPYTA